MLNVEDNQSILCLYFQAGFSINEIAKELKINWRTVAKRVKEFERLRRLPSDELAKEPQKLLDYLSKGSVYDFSTRKPRVLNEEMASFINARLLANEEKKLKGLRKQQLKNKDIHELLIAEGYQVDYSTVCRYIRRQLQFSPERFVKQLYTEGRVAEFDWCEVHLYIAGNRKRFYMAAFASAYSNYRFAILYERQDTLAFQDAHNRFFEHVGGVYHQLVFDNMKVAVKEFVGKDQKKPTQALLNMATWYQFEWRFCNVASGNEKPHVERTCEVVRRKCFATVDHFSCFDEAQAYLSERVAILNAHKPGHSQTSPLDRFDCERNSLRPFPGILECYEALNLKVDKFGTVCCKTNHYSVPEELCAQVIFVKLYASHLSFMHNGKEACRHVRSYKKNDWILNLDHYLNTFKRKPGALAGSVAMNQAPGWLKDLYRLYFTDQPRDFAELLLYCREHEIPETVLLDGVALLKKNYPSSVDKDHLIALLGNHQSDMTRAGLDAENERSFCDIINQSTINIKELTAIMMN